MNFLTRWHILPGDIVFLGDSLTNGAPWRQAFPDLPVKNRGVDGDTVQGVLNRLDAVIRGKPAAVFLMIGTNNLFLPYIDRDSEILRYYAEILKRLRAGTPGAQVFVQSILPRGREFAGRIRSLNREISALARLHGCEYIDLFPHFADQDGALRREYTFDELHLLPDGYRVWTDLLGPCLAALRAPSKS